MLEIHWRADSKKEYRKIIKAIGEMDFKSNLFDIYGWCDISGYQTWKSKTPPFNYLIITVEFKVKKIDLIHEEMIKSLISDYQDKIKEYQV